MRSVFMIDGAFLTRVARQVIQPVTARLISDFVEAVRDKYDGGFDLLRIYYYDCPPSDKRTLRPVSRSAVNFGTSPQFTEQTVFLADLKHTNFVAVREGRVSFNGWILKDDIARGRAPRTGTDTDYAPDFEQKGVDMKIGLDIAWVSLSKVAQRVYLVTGDSDFIPAMKFARRSGIHVCLFTLGHGVYPELKNHADLLVETPIQTILNQHVRRHARRRLMHRP